MRRVRRIFRNSSRKARSSQDDKSNFYLYRQIMGQHAQVGLVAAASCEEYLANIIKKHEFTRPDKEDDRVRHIEALNSQTGPVFLTYRAQAALDEFVAKKISETPAVDFTGRTVCATRRGPFPTRTKSNSSKRSSPQIPFFYIADGHHRSAAAARVFQSRQGAGQSSGRISHRHFSAQPDADSALQPGAEGFERPHAAELLKKLEEVFKSSAWAKPRPHANTNSDCS
jgi:uncharacterized protein (DUF1015 family)